jgi:arginine decarboxylase
MNTKYTDLINQTYYSTQEEFKLEKDNLQFHKFDEISRKSMVHLKIYLSPQISNNINKAKVGLENQ